MLFLSEHLSAFVSRLQHKRIKIDFQEFNLNCFHCCTLRRYLMSDKFKFLKLRSNIVLHQSLFLRHCSFNCTFSLLTCSDYVIPAIKEIIWHYNSALDQSRDENGMYFVRKIDRWFFAIFRWFHHIFDPA